jgi:serine/threonine protein kinase
VLNEIQLLKSTHHPHIIPLLSSNTASSDTFDLIFPFYSHGDLFHLLIKHGKFNESLTKEVAKQLGKALEYLHLTCGIVHRDVKLENCLVESLNWSESSIHVVLADFGLVSSWNQCRN